MPNKHEDDFETSNFLFKVEEEKTTGGPPVLLMLMGEMPMPLRIPLKTRL